METKFITLEDCDISGTGIERKVPSGYVERKVTRSEFDRSTLFYNAIWSEGRFGGGTVAVVSPRLLNLEPLLTGDGVAFDGIPAKAKRVVHHLGSSTVYFRLARQPNEISVLVDGQHLVAPVAGTEDRTIFRGLNTLVTASKNNELLWIEDFARYHRIAHGLQAVMFFDNASDAYAPQDIAAALERAGIQRAVVMTAPKPWGIVGQGSDGKTDWSGLTLQLALLNIARLRFLGEARAVLNCDIDEMVWNEGGSIFDRACRSPLGFVQFRGEWRWAPFPEDRLVRHGDHSLRSAKPGICPSKWCLNPRGPLGASAWEVHRLARRPWMRVNSGVRGAGFWHCRAISKNWKAAARRHTLPNGLVEDRGLPVALSAAGFSEPEAKSR